MTPVEKREAERQAKVLARAERAAAKAKAKVLAAAKAKAPPMSPTKYREHLKKLEIPISVAGNYFGMGARQAQKIASGEFPVPRLVGKIVKLLDEGKIKKEDLL